MQFINSFKTKFAALPGRAELGRARKALPSEAVVEFELLAQEVCRGAQLWKLSQLVDAETAKLLQPIAYACCSDRVSSGAETAFLASLRLQTMGRREAPQCLGIGARKL